MSINQKRPIQTDDFIRVQDLLYLCLSKWKWFVLSLAVTVGIAVFYLLRTPPVYTQTASVLIKDDSKGKSVSSDLESFSAFGLFQSSTNVNHELVALQSPAVLTEVEGRKLTFNVGARDAGGMIGEGVHIRYVVDRAKFMAKLG